METLRCGFCGQVIPASSDNIAGRLVCEPCVDEMLEPRVFVSAYGHLDGGSRVASPFASVFRGGGR